MHLPSMTLEEINGRCKQFYKRFYEEYLNPHKVCQHLDQSIVLGLGMVASTLWVPGMEDHGHITVSFSNRDVDRKRGRVETLKLDEFIHKYYNPQGAYMLERVIIDLEG